MKTETMERTAYLSRDKVYRFSLSRRWDYTRRAVVWVMLNPSTADAEIDDNTITRCIGFSQGFGFGKLVVVNLFAYRTAYPKDLLTAKKPKGHLNENHMRVELEAAETVIVAWGAPSNLLWRKSLETRQVVKEYRSKLKCLGKTKSGAPRHPLYMRSDTKLEEWP